MIELSEHAKGWILPVRAQPGAKKNGVQGEHNGALKVAVTAPATEGKANKALLETLRDLLDLKRSQLELLSGDTARDKRFLISGLSRTDLEARLRKLLA